MDLYVIYQHADGDVTMDRYQRYLELDSSIAFHEVIMGALIQF